MLSKLKHVLWVFSGALIWSASLGVLCSQRSPMALSILAAVTAGLVGAASGFFLARSRLRLAGLWLGAAALIALVCALISFARNTTLFSVVLGPSLLFSLSEACGWLLVPWILVAVLRASTQRQSAFVVLEVGAVGLVLSSIFAGHRDGFINRPFFLVDPLFGAGWDPTPVFLGLGALVGVVLIGLMASLSAQRRSFLDLFLLMVLIFGCFLFVPVARLKDFQGKQLHGGTGDLKLPGDGTGEGQGGQGGSQGQQGGSQGGSQGQQGGSQGGGQGQQGGAQSGGQGGQGGQGGEQQQGQDGQSQQTDELKFSDRQEQEKDSPVAVVIFRDDYEPPGGVYYFRQDAFSVYNGTKLVRDASGKFDRDALNDFPTRATPVDVPELRDFRFFSETDKPRVGSLDPTAFKQLETTVALIAEHSRPFGLNNPVSFAPRSNPDPSKFQRAYSVTSMVVTKPYKEILQYQPGNPSWDQETWDHYLAAPRDPRYAKLAEEILQTLPEEYRDIPMARVIAIKLWMEKNCIYSLTTKHNASDTPVESFLFGDRTGYCVFLGHSAAYLYRTLGIPARVCHGYAVEAAQRGGGSSLLIRSKNAHEWAEVYLDGLGWTDMDISPERTLEKPQEQVDQSLQQMMGELARKDPEDPPPDDKPRQDLQEILRKLALALLKAFPWCFLAVLAGLYGIKIYRRTRPYFAPDARLPVVVYRATLDKLADRGLLRTKGETRGEFARRLSSLCPSFAELTERHLEHALGPGARPSNRQRYLQLMQETTRQAERHASFGRKLLFILNPISWWWVK
ncbi:DUF4129 domain-containing protein [bacterium CPR1]|nr:DUF4129 domain-containing protein [bacterium CPR1]